MKRTFLVLGTAIVVLPWLAGAKVQADAIHWTASGSVLEPNSQQIYSQSNGWIDLIPGKTTSGTNSGSVVALNVDYGSNPNGPAYLTFGGPSANYALGLALHDDASGDSGSLTFRGNLSGAIDNNEGSFTNTFFGPTTQTLTLGQNQYTVTIGPYVNPQPYKNAPLGGGGGGSISASIAVQPSISSNNPEPSSLVLAFLGLSSLGLANRFRRRKDADDNAGKA